MATYAGYNPNSISREKLKEIYEKSIIYKSGHFDVERSFNEFFQRLRIYRSHCGVQTPYEQLLAKEAVISVHHKFECKSLNKAHEKARFLAKDKETLDEFVIIPDELYESVRSCIDKIPRTWLSEWAKGCQSGETYTIVIEGSSNNTSPSWAEGD